MVDEAVQSDAPDEFVSGPPLKRRPRPRGSKGNRKAQMQRYRERNAVRLRDYWRRYRAAQRKAVKATASALQAGLL
jgi:ribosomal protein L32E